MSAFGVMSVGLFILYRFEIVVFAQTVPRILDSKFRGNTFELILRYIPVRKCGDTSTSVFEFSQEYSTRNRDSMLVE